VLKKHLAGSSSTAARFVQLLALSRLHGHSRGFFSVYSMPQLSLHPQAQRRINHRRGQQPEYRAIAPRIISKAKAVLRDNLLKEIRTAAEKNIYSTQDARNLTTWPSGQVDLVVTSPPFLYKVDYITGNWLELWFLDIPREILQHGVMQTANMSEWKEFIKDVLPEIGRILKTGGICVLEVGDITFNKEKVYLDEIVAELALEKQQHSKLILRQVLIHRQDFSKLSHCFQVINNCKGTNTHRLLIMEKV
jgi:hypothetical protein